MSADALATLGASASADMVLTPKAAIYRVPSPASEESTDDLAPLYDGTSADSLTKFGS